MNKKLVMLTAYDYPTAKILDESGIDYILVGDSLGMVVLGYPDTKSVTMEDMTYHVKAVSRGVKHSVIIADLPAHSYGTKIDALKNAKQLISAGAHMVKIEGNTFDIIQVLIQNHIRVVGHLGLLPQTAEKYMVQGRDPRVAEQIYTDAKVLESAGVELLVLECIPQELARKITQDLETPTIGIGAGKYCDGQVLVLHDVIGLSDFKGKMVKQYANVTNVIREAVAKFKQEVITEKFPAMENSFE